MEGHETAVTKESLSKMQAGVEDGLCLVATCVLCVEDFIFPVCGTDSPQWITKEKLLFSFKNSNISDQGQLYWLGFRFLDVFISRTCVQ